MRSGLNPWLKKLRSTGGSTCYKNATEQATALVTELMQNMRVIHPHSYAGIDPSDPEYGGAVYTTGGQLMFDLHDVDHTYREYGEKQLETLMRLIASGAVTMVDVAVMAIESDPDYRAWFNHNAYKVADRWDSGVRFCLVDGYLSAQKARVQRADEADDRRHREKYGDNPPLPSLVDRYEDFQRLVEAADIQVPKPSGIVVDFGKDRK